MSTGLSGIRASADNLMSGFSSPETPSANDSFLQSNSIIAKFAFLILVLFGFVVAFNVGINTMGYFINGAPNPYLVKGMIEGSNPMVISQDPKKTGSVTLLRSDNQETGLEFTWSVWLYITGTGSGSLVHYQNVFNKGNGKYNSHQNSTDLTTAISSKFNVADSTTVYNWDTGAGVDAIVSGIASVNNGPGLYVKSHNLTSSLLIVMDTVDPLVPTQQLLVDEVPINKWFHLAIRMENTLMDAYVNGVIAARASFTAVPKQNYNDVNVCQNGGFDGKLSNLQYFSRALSAFAINNIVRYGPDTTMVGASAAISGSSPYYIADSWFYSKIGSS
jgi:hypothetical protein